IGIEVIDSFKLLLLNIVILLLLGVTIIYTYYSLIQGNRKNTLYALIFTIILAIVFIGFQVIEYLVLLFTILNSVFESCFYFKIGFHGLYIIIGIVFLVVGL
ncbi:cytochrome c oxidase, subunit III, partial [Lepidopterella palustris CBS 459.81]